MLKRQIYLNTATTAQFYEVPLMLTQTVEDIGIYTDFTSLMEIDVNSVEINGSDLSSTQISYLLQKVTDLQTYISEQIGIAISLSQPVKTNEEYTVQWWDNVAKNNLDAFNLTKELIIAIDFTFESIKIKTIETGKTIDDMLGHVYSALTPNWEIQKDGILNYFTNPLFLITGTSANRLNEVRTYDPNNPFVIGTNGLTQINNQFTAYTLDNINYITFSGGVTTFAMLSPGFNKNNITLDHIIKEDFLSGVVLPPKVDDELEVERQKTSVLDPFYRLKQIGNVEQFNSYGNGYYNVDDQSSSIKHGL